MFFGLFREWDRHKLDFTKDSMYTQIFQAVSNTTDKDYKEFKDIWDRYSKQNWTVYFIIM
jgi:hypothetical protein